jgi:hypothetical protein
MVGVGGGTSLSGLEDEADEAVLLEGGRRERTDQVGLERRSSMSSNWGFGGLLCCGGLVESLADGVENSLLNGALEMKVCILDVLTLFRI